MGGSDDPSNLVELTVEEHAEAHRILFEKYGRKEDELAWKGLAGIIGKEELLHELFVLSGKKSKHPGPHHKPRLGIKWSDEYKKMFSDVSKGIKKTEEHKLKISIARSKYWNVTKPDGSKELVKNLEKYCRDNNLSSSKMYCVANKTRNHHKGYVCERVN